MAITSYRLAEVLKNTDQPVTRQLVLDLLVDSISPRERQLYYFVAEQKTTTSRTISKKFKMSINSVDNMLNRLLQYGLLSRDGLSGGSGLHYEWTIAK